MTTTSSYPKSEISGRRTFFSSSSMVWLLLVAYLILVKVVILPLFPQIQIDVVAQNFSWDNIIIFSFVGLVGVWLADRTGFMPALDARVSNRQRYLIPLFVGGGIGIALGVLASRGISLKMNWPTLTSPSAILFAFVFSAAVGVFFRFYPARKASKLDPIDALRYQ